MVVTMESDNPEHNKAQAKHRMIRDFIASNFPDVSGKRDFFGQYEVKDREQYNQIYVKIESLVDNPYEFESPQTGIYKAGYKAPSLVIAPRPGRPGRLEQSKVGGRHRFQ